MEFFAASNNTFTYTSVSVPMPIFLNPAMNIGSINANIIRNLAPSPLLFSPNPRIIADNMNVII